MPSAAKRGPGAGTEASGRAALMVTAAAEADVAESALASGRSSCCRFAQPSAVSSATQPNARRWPIGTPKLPTPRQRGSIPSEPRGKRSGLADGLRWIGVVESALPALTAGALASILARRKTEAPSAGHCDLAGLSGRRIRGKASCARHRQALRRLRGLRGCGFFGLSRRRRLRRGARDQQKAREQPVRSHVVRSIHGRQTPSQLGFV
jgi:hypothetical protein